MSDKKKRTAVVLQNTINVTELNKALTIMKSNTITKLDEIIKDVDNQITQLLDSSAFSDTFEWNNALYELGLTKQNAVVLRQNLFDNL